MKLNYGVEDLRAKQDEDAEHGKAVCMHDQYFAQSLIGSFLAYLESRPRLYSGASVVVYRFDPRTCSMSVLDPAFRTVWFTYVTSTLSNE